MKLHHVIEAQQFDVPTINHLFEVAAEMEKLVASGGTDEYRNRLMATLFYEPSTRTRFSFEAAMHRLGGRVISTENAAEFSSVAKGETLEDTIRIMNGYVDVIVLRHSEVGAAKRAAAVSRVPVINAGDGMGQHPSQALLDLYTIHKEIGSIDGLKIAMVGDLAQGRTVRSLAYLLRWAYFSDDTAAEHTFADTPPQRRAMVAIYAFGYAHLVLLLGIVVIAAGVKKAIGQGSPRCRSACGWPACSCSCWSPRCSARSPRRPAAVPPA